MLLVSDETGAYDALNRISSWSEIGVGGFAAGEKLPNATHTFVYDANGNIRRSTATYYALNSQGAATGSAATQDYWYKYDSLNRMTTSQGALSGGAISRGTTGVDIVYDNAGNRLYTIAMVSGAAKREDYTYDAANRVTQINSGATLTWTGTNPNAKRSAFSYDLMGRMTLHNDYATNGTSVVYSDSRTLNAKGQVTSESVSTVRGSTTYLAASSYTYGAGASYALGSPLTITTINYENGVQKKTNLTSNSYFWSDGPIQAQIDYTPDTSAPTVVNHTTYNYDRIGGQNQLGQIVINDGRPRTVQFRNDFMGQGIRRDETDNITTAGDPHELWYRFSGREMLYDGNNGTVDTDEATSVTNRTASQGTGAFFNGASSGTSFADSDLAYDSINSYDQGSTGGMYTVRDGDTLASIASSLWGDSSLWYKIAELNGLTADSALPTGMPLLIPVGVIRSTNNATTYKPYDPAEVVGNTMPTAVKPPKSKHNCGVLGQIVMVVIAAVVAIYTAGAYLALTGAGAVGSVGTGVAVVTGTATAATTASVGATSLIAAGAVGGAAGSIVSQAVGVATGIQDKFSWNAVALAAIGGGVGAGLGASGVGGTGWQGAAVRGALGNAIGQGVAVATGLQSKFSWAGVAAAGIGGAVNLHFRNADVFTQIAASTIADAATHSLLEGTDFGDNILAALPNVIGSTIGNAIARDMAGTDFSEQRTSTKGKLLKDWTTPGKHRGGDLPASAIGRPDGDDDPGDVNSIPYSQRNLPYTTGQVDDAPVEEVVVTGHRNINIAHEMTATDLALVQLGRDAYWNNHRARYSAEQQAQFRADLNASAAVDRDFTNRAVIAAGVSVLEGMPLIGDGINVARFISKPTWENFGVAAVGLGAPALAKFGVPAAMAGFRRLSGALEEARAGARTAEEIVEEARPPNVGPVQRGEITTYEDFVDRSVVGDGIEGHELWQHANIREQGLATSRMSTVASKNNPVIALDHDTHVQVSRAQRNFDVSAQTPVENINANAQILRDLNVAPESDIARLQSMAREHAQTHGFWE
ncbi:MAG: LysM peptidoglycan-binding domain-containing protein [Terricaulis sp.]